MRSISLQALVLAALFCILLPASSNAQDITTGLDGYWKLEETSGTTAADSSGSGYTGNLSSGFDPTTASKKGKIGKALYFDGDPNDTNTGNAIVTTLSTSAKTETYAAWISPSSYPTGTAGAKYAYDIMAKGTDSGAGAVIMRLLSTGYLVIYVNGSGGSGALEACVSSSVIPLNQWSHITASRNEASLEIKVYVNGALEKTCPITQTVNSNTTNIRIGRHPSTSFPYYFHGIIDEARHYSRALNDEDIALLASSYPGALTCDASREAVMIFNQQEKVLQYCNGTKWISVGQENTYHPQGVYFDKSTNITATMSGLSNSYQVTGSFWIKSIDSSVIIFAAHNAGSTQNYIGINHTSASRLVISGYNAAGTQIASFRTSGNENFTDGKWHHVMFSYDTSDTTATKRHMYVDGVSSESSLVWTPGSMLGFSQIAGATMAREGGTFSKTNLADLWIDLGTYVDLDNPDNRKKFYNNGPVYLGEHGELPLSSSPEIFLTGGTSLWPTNSGTTGTFTVGNGSLQASSNNPTKSSTSSCSSPSGVAGEIIFNSTESVMQFCDGSSWVAMGPQNGAMPTSAPTNGLVGHWKLDETTGTTAADSSGNGNDGTLTGTDFATSKVAGKLSGAVNLDGSNDFIETTDSTVLKPSFPLTVSVWVRYNAYPPNADGIIRADYQSGLYSGFWLNANNTGLWGVSYGDGTGNGASDRRSLASTSPLSLNQWYHLVAVIRGATDMSLYQNGIAINVTYSGSGNTAISYSTTGKFLIGKSIFNSTNGAIDDVRVYNRELTADEVASLYLSTGGDKIAADCTGLGNMHYNDPDTGHCYYGNNTNSVSWPNARLDCISNGGYLAQITSQAENDLIRTKLAISSYMIGASDNVTEGKWIWNDGPFAGKQFWSGTSTGTSVNDLYSNWKPSEPNASSSSEDYVKVSTDGTWNDAGGTYGNYVCEIGQNSGLGSCSSPHGVGGTIVYNDDHNIMQYCNGEEWIAMGDYNGSATTYPDPPASCNAIGETCNDGTIYVGLSPDGNAPMFTTQCDHGLTWNGSSCTGSASSTTWNQSYSYTGYTTSGVTSSITGAANTEALLTIDSDTAPGTQTHSAAMTCANLSAYGYDDWYLPASNELNKLVVNKNKINGFPLADYWSSTETAQVSAAMYGLAADNMSLGTKNGGKNVRCVRKGIAVADTTAPTWVTAAGTVATVPASSSLSATVTATDDSGSVTYSKSSGDAWISVNTSTGGLTGTVPATAGTYSITVTATDPYGYSADRTFTVTVTAANKIVFVTSTTYTGNIGGITGADAACNARATAAGLSGTYKAWLTTLSTTEPIDRFTQSTVPYKLLNGTTIANNWADLIDGTLAAPINRNENNVAVTGKVWTHTRATGAEYNTTAFACVNGTSAVASDRGVYGSATATDSTWSLNAVDTCNVSYRLYCFEQ